jgi:hypothetical protein
MLLSTILSIAILVCPVQLLSEPNLWQEAGTHCLLGTTLNISKLKTEKEQA